MEEDKMRLFRALILSVFLMLGCSAFLFAAEVQGMVDSINASNNSIVIKDPVTGAGRTVIVHPKVLADLKKGTVVKAALKPGSDNTAETLQVLITE